MMEILDDLIAPLNESGEKKVASKQRRSSHLRAHTNYYNNNTIHTNNCHDYNKPMPEENLDSELTYQSLDILAPNESYNKYLKTLQSLKAESQQSIDQDLMPMLSQHQHLSTDILELMSCTNKISQENPCLSVNLDNPVPEANLELFETVPTQTEKNNTCKKIAKRGMTKNHALYNYRKGNRKFTPSKKKDQTNPFVVPSMHNFHLMPCCIKLPRINVAQRHNIDLRCFLTKEEESDSEGDDVIEKDWCSVCKDGGDLLCCSWCPRVFHMSCYIPVLQTFPKEENWRCSFCDTIDASISKPKKKKKSQSGLSVKEFKNCERVLLELLCYKHSLPFHVPVDKALTEYYKKIETPMDLRKVRETLYSKKTERYQTVKEFINDIRLIFQNCFTFNSKSSKMYIAGSKTETFFEDLLVKYFPKFAYDIMFGHY